MTWKRKIPGEGACGPCCSWKEKFNQLWDRAIGCITKINNITPDGDGKFEIRGGTGVQVTPISNGVEINSTATGAGIATINGNTGDSDSNFTIAGASGRNGVTVTDTTHGITLSVGDFIETVNDVTADVFGNLNLTAGSNVTITPDADNHSIEIASTASGGVTPQDVEDALDAYAPMVRTTGNQNIGGNKTFTGTVQCNSALTMDGELGIGLPNSPQTNKTLRIRGKSKIIFDKYFTATRDINNAAIRCLNNDASYQNNEIYPMVVMRTISGGSEILSYFGIRPNNDGSVSVMLHLLNSDKTTYKDVEIARSDVI